MLYVLTLFHKPSQMGHLILRILLSLKLLPFSKILLQNFSMKNIIQTFFFLVSSWEIFRARAASSILCLSFERDRLLLLRRERSRDFDLLLDRSFWDFRSLGDLDLLLSESFFFSLFTSLDLDFWGLGSRRRFRSDSLSRLRSRLRSRLTGVRARSRESFDRFLDRFLSSSRLSLSTFFFADGCSDIFLPGLIGAWSLSNFGFFDSSLILNSVSLHYS